MIDDREPLDLDARLRAALTPDHETVRRVAARSLAEEPRVASRSRPLYAFSVVAAALVAVVTAIVASSRGEREGPTPAAASLSVTGRGSLLAVESSDGRRWIVGAEPGAPRGRYVIAIHP